MLNDIGVNLIQVESNTAPLVEPVEIGVLGIAGRFYRGTKLMRLRGAGEDLISNIYKRLGTPFENFRNHAYYNVLGHVQNSVTYGSSLVIHRLRGNNARVARTYTNLTVDSNTGERTYTSHVSPTVMRLVSKEINRTQPYYVSHDFNSNLNLYNLKIRKPRSQSRTVFNVSVNVPDTLLNQSFSITARGNIFTYNNGQKQINNNVVFLDNLQNIFQNNPDPNLTFVGLQVSFPVSSNINDGTTVIDRLNFRRVSNQNYFACDVSSVDFSGISFGRILINRDIDFSQLPIVAVFEDSSLQLVEIPTGFFLELFVLEISDLRVAFSFSPISSINNIYPQNSAICFDTGLFSVFSGNTSPIEVCFYTNSNGEIFKLGIRSSQQNVRFVDDSNPSSHFNTAIQSLALSNFTLVNGVYQSSSPHVRQLSLVLERCDVESYTSTSLSSLAFCLNNGEPVERQKTSDELIAHSGLLIRSVLTSIPSYFFDPLAQPYVPIETDFTGASRFVSVEFVTQSSTVPVENVEMFLWAHNVPNYNVNLHNNFIGAASFYFSAAQQNEDDWGSWGNNLSVVVSPSKIDPTFRRLTVYLRSEGVKRVVEEIEDTEKAVLNYLRGSGYVKLNLSPENSFSFMPFIPNLELTLMDGDDGVFNKSVFLGSVQDSTGAYIFAGTNATSITCPEVTSGITGLSSNDVIEIIDSYASVALTSNKTAIFTLPRNISRDEIFSTYTRQFLKERSNLILYRANGAVSDGRGGRINTSLVGHIHGAAFVRWRLSQSTFPNIVPKGDPTYLNGVFSLDKEVYSKTEITDYVRVLGVNPVVLTGSGFTIEGARTMSRKNVHYSIHATELTNFYIDSIARFASFLKSEFNDEVSQKKFAQRVTDFTRVMYDARCLETEGGFNNNFQIKVDSSVNPIESRRRRIFNARIKIRWIEQIEAINIFFEKTDESVNATIG